MKRTRFLVLMLGVLISHWIAAPSSADDRQKLVGTWKITMFQDDGRDRLERLGAGPAKKKDRSPRVAYLVFSQEACYVIRGDGQRESKPGLANAAWKSCTLDESASPKTIDIVGFAGKEGQKSKTYLGIYKIEDDKLTICYCEQGNKRPTEFQSDGAMNLFAAERLSDKPLPLPKEKSEAETSQASSDPKEN